MADDQKKEDVIENDEDASSILDDADTNLQDAMTALGEDNPDYGDIAEQIEKAQDYLTQVKAYVDGKNE